MDLALQIRRVPQDRPTAKVLSRLLARSSQTDNRNPLARLHPMNSSKPLDLLSHQVSRIPLGPHNLLDRIRIQDPSHSQDNHNLKVPPMIQDLSNRLGHLKHHSNHLALLCHQDSSNLQVPLSLQANRAPPEPHNPRASNKTEDPNHRQDSRNLRAHRIARDPSNPLVHLRHHRNLPTRHSQMKSSNPLARLSHQANRTPLGPHHLQASSKTEDPSHLRVSRNLQANRIALDPSNRPGHLKHHRNLPARHSQMNSNNLQAPLSLQANRTPLEPHNLRDNSRAQHLSHKMASRNPQALLHIPLDHPQAKVSNSHLGLLKDKPNLQATPNRLNNSNNLSHPLLMASHKAQTPNHNLDILNNLSHRNKVGNSRIMETRYQQVSSKIRTPNNQTVSSKAMAVMVEMVIKVPRDRSKAM